MVGFSRLLPQNTLPLPPLVVVLFPVFVFPYAWMLEEQNNSQLLVAILSLSCSCRWTQNTNPPCFLFLLYFPAIIVVFHDYGVLVDYCHDLPPPSPTHPSRFFVIPYPCVIWCKFTEEEQHFLCYSRSFVMVVMFWQIVVIKCNTLPHLLDDVLFFFILVLLLCKHWRGVVAMEVLQKLLTIIEVLQKWMVAPPQPTFGPTNSYQHQ
jgi:hypothetical protein